MGKTAVAFIRFGIHWDKSVLSLRVHRIFVPSVQNQFYIRRIVWCLFYWFFYRFIDICTAVQFIFIYVWGWSGTESTITAAVYWPVVPHLDVRWWWLWSNWWNEWVAGEIEVHRGNLSQCSSGHHRSHMTWPGLDPGPPRWVAGN
jgi:hypothetical protein